MKTSAIGGKRIALGLAALTGAAVIYFLADGAAAQRFGRGPSRPVPAAGKTAPGLHITEGDRVNNWNYQMTDSENKRWDIQTSGGVGSGTNYCFSGGYLTINNNWNFGTGNALVSKNKDEIEIGPYSPDSRVRISRRIKVYKDQPLARWLDIYENTTGQQVQLTLMDSSSSNYGIVKTTTSSGGATFGEKDTAVVTETQQGIQPQPPAVCTLLCDKKSKFRPTVQTNGGAIQVRWNLVLAPNSTAIICKFQSQDENVDHLTKLMNTFNASKMMKDLPTSVRKLILNFSTGSTFEDVDLERSEKYDTILMANGDPKYGKLVNKTYSLETGFGQLKLPAEQVVGMVILPKDPERVRVLLKDGQIICGKPGPEKLQIELVPGPVLQIPMEEIAQCSYAISKERPDDTPSIGPFVMLRTGDRLGFDASAVSLTLRTKNGDLPLSPKEVMRVALDNAGNGVHRAHFLNGSVVGGFLEPAKIPLALKLGGKADLSRDLVTEFLFNPGEPDTAPMTHISLSNGDELLGMLADTKLQVQSDIGTVNIQPRNIRKLTFAGNSAARVSIELWDTSKVQGELDQQELAFQIVPGPAIKIPLTQVVSLDSPFPLPGDDELKRVKDLIGKLGDADWKTRQKAMQDLQKMGSTILPLLRERQHDPDAELRMRVEELIEKFGGEVKEAPPPDDGPMRTNLQLRAAW